MLTRWLLDDFRFFVLNNESGLLEYFVNEQSRPQKPRGMLPLAGAVISPSDEDSHTFTVNAISGEQYKLRGGCHLPANIDVTHQPYRQASTLTPVHQIYSILISLLWWHSGIDAASACPFARVTSFLLSSFFFCSCLTASDAKERQHWVSRLQICTQHHTEAMGKVWWCVLNVFMRAYLQLGTMSIIDPFTFVLLLESVPFCFESLRICKIQILE